MLNKIRETRAFTLIEIIICMVIIVIFTLFLVRFFKSVNYDAESEITIEQPQVTEKGDLKKL